MQESFQIYLGETDIQNVFLRSEYVLNCSEFHRCNTPQEQRYNVIVDFAF